MPPAPIKVTQKGNTSILVGQRPDGQFIPIQVDNDGLLLTSGGGGGGGTATEAKQDDQIVQLATLISNTAGLSTEATLDLVRQAVQASDATLTTIASTVATEATAQQMLTALGTLSTEATAQDILAALGPLATGVDVAAVESAVTALAGGSSIADVVTALAPLATAATEVTAAAILASAQAIEVDIDAMRTSVANIDANTDQVEAKLDTIAGRLWADQSAGQYRAARLTFDGANYLGLGQQLATASIPIVPASDWVLPTGTNWVGNVKVGDGTNTATTLASAATGTERGLAVHIVTMPAVTATVTGVATETTLSALNGKFASAATMSTGSGTVPSTTQVYAWQIGYNTSALGGSNTPVILPATIYGSMVQGYVANGAAIGSTERGIVAAGKDTAGNKQQIATDTSGRMRSVQVRNLAADGTTDAPTRFPTLGDFTASSSGVALVKATGGRLFMFDVYYTGSTASGLWLHAHDAASATTPVTGTIKKSWPINNGANIQIEWDSFTDLCFTNGIKFTISSTRLTESTATTETFLIAAWGV
jgi:hypothetical protein